MKIKFSQLLFLFFILVFSGPLSALADLQPFKLLQPLQQDPYEIGQKIILSLRSYQSVPGVISLGDAPAIPHPTLHLEQNLEQIFSPLFTAYFKQLFHTLIKRAAAKGISVDLSPYDLFHGHVLQISPYDLAIIFHAKEYPRDPDMVLQNGGKGKNSPFTTSDRNYPYRNFLWILSLNQYWVFDASPDSPLPKILLLPMEFQLEETDPERTEIVSLFLKAKTLQENYFIREGKYLGSVNYDNDAYSGEGHLSFNRPSNLVSK